MIIPQYLILKIIPQSLILKIIPQSLILKIIQQFLITPMIIRLNLRMKQFQRTTTIKLSLIQIKILQTMETTTKQYHQTITIKQYLQTMEIITLTKLTQLQMNQSSQMMNQSDLQVHGTNTKYLTKILQINRRMMILTDGILISKAMIVLLFKSQLILCLIVNII